MSFTIWNRDDGFVDAMVRGWRSTFLTDPEYTNLKEGGRRGNAGKEDFEDLRLTLQETDYGNFLQSEPSLDPKLIAQKATEKWVKEFRYFRATAVGPMATFMDFISAEYLIDNVLDVIKAAVSSSQNSASASGGRVDVESLFENCHPLGMLEEGVMKSIIAYEDLGEDFFSLYRTVLVDTPVGKYFTQFLQEIADEKSAGDIESVKAALADIPFTLLETGVKRLYLEDFFRFCKDQVGGETAEVMCDILATRADAMAINIAYNSLALGPNHDLARASGKSSKSSLFPSVGHLYPEGCELLAKAEDEDGIRRALLLSRPQYASMWDAAPVDARGVRDINDAFFRLFVKQLELAFDGQFHYSPFYAYAKLKEQEVKNIAWIATCLEHGVYTEMDRIIPVFSRIAGAKR